MSNLNTTLNTAKRVSAGLNIQPPISNSNCHIKRTTLTEIMTSDEMINLYILNIDEKNKSFICENFDDWYEMVNIRAPDDVNLNNGIKALLHLIEFLENQSDNKIVRNNKHNNKSQPLNNHSCSESPKQKKQRSSSYPKNTRSLQDVMTSKHPDNEIIQKINEQWHNKKDNKIKWENLKTINKHNFQFVNTELLFDNQHSQAVRERIKVNLNQYVGCIRSKCNENNNDDNDIKVDEIEMEMQDDDIFYDVDNINMRNVKFNESALDTIAEFCKSTTMTMAKLMDINNSKEILSYTLDTVFEIFRSFLR